MSPTDLYRVQPKQVTLQGGRVIDWTPEYLEQWAKERHSGHQFDTGYGPVFCPSREKQWGTADDDSTTKLGAGIVDDDGGAGGLSGTEGSPAQPVLLEGDAGNPFQPESELRGEHPLELAVRPGDSLAWYSKGQIPYVHIATCVGKLVEMTNQGGDYYVFYDSKKDEFRCYHRYGEVTTQKVYKLQPAK